MRNLYQQKRGELTVDQIRDYSGRIAERLFAVLSGRSIDFLHIFLPITSGKEVDTWLMIKWLQEEKKEVRIVLPRIITGSRELEHYVYNSEVPLVVNRWAIPEPDPEENAPIFPEQLDVVIIPLLCFDASGYRVGYGGGYYDRFLAKCKPDVIKIGLSFFEVGPSIDDIDEYDIAMDYSITPDRTFNF